MVKTVNSLFCVFYHNQKTGGRPLPRTGEKGSTARQTEPQETSCSAPVPAAATGHRTSSPLKLHVGTRGVAVEGGRRLLTLETSDLTAKKTKNKVGGKISKS